MNKTSWKVALAARQRLGHCRRAAGGSAGSRYATAGDGVWSATVGPVTAEEYVYYFIVDGVRLPDPANPQVKRSRRGLRVFPWTRCC
jgi:hypothetical protein